MLTYSRRDNQDDLEIKLGPLLNENIEMLRASLPSSIDIITKVEPHLPYVMMNPTNFHQILMNLLINARDATQGTGEIIVSLSLARNLNTQSQVSHKQIKGDWVELSVSDNGSGIDIETIKYIFEPFFTTKDVGEGTGMGLSVIYGIMQGHNGHILVQSELGKGTTFRMLFPPIKHKSKPLVQDKPTQAKPTESHGERILVVDDEKSLANFMAELLTNNGYEPCSTTDSSEALDIFKRDPDHFSMLITDFTMPKVTGEKLIEMVRDIRPELPVILCTGQSDKFDIDMAKKLNIPFFKKPVDSESILLKISELLNKNKIH